MHSTIPHLVNAGFCFAPVHLWRYRGGYPALTEVMTKLRENKVRVISHLCSHVFLTINVIESNSNGGPTMCVYLWIDLCCFLFQEFVEYRKERGKMLLSRRNQLLLEFSFWNEPLPRPGPSIYEMRSYRLKVARGNTLCRQREIFVSDALVTRWIGQGPHNT